MESVAWIEKFIGVHRILKNCEDKEIILAITCELTKKQKMNK